MIHTTDQTESVPLENRRRNRQDTSEQDGDIENIIQRIDVHSFTGLMTILAVNIQQLYMLIAVGPDLGTMFYLLITLTSMSAILVVGLTTPLCSADDRQPLRNGPRCEFSKIVFSLVIYAPPAHYVHISSLTIILSRLIRLLDHCAVYYFSYQILYLDSIIRPTILPWDRED